MSVHRGQPMPIAWDPENAFKPPGSYCVRARLADGSQRYITARGKIDRMNKPEAELQAATFRTWFKEAIDQKNPACYTSSSGRFGRYSDLLKIKEPDEQVIECVDAEAVQYSTTLENEEHVSAQWYAPLCYLVDSGSEKTLTIGLAVPLLSDPSKTDAFLDNWRCADIHFEDVEVRVIADDAEFDHAISQYLADGMQVVIDPLVDHEGKLVTGLPVDSIWNIQHAIRRSSGAGD
jgi:hypothetical protein